MSVATGSHTRNLFVYGKSGTGKTVATKHTMGLVQRHGNLQVPIIPLYVNCRGQGTHHALLSKLVEELTKNPAQLAPNTSWRTLCNQFQEACQRANANIVVVLDEADGISKYKGEADSLYFLSNLNSDMGNSRSTVSIIAVTNDLHYGENLAERVQSRLRVEKLHFPPYDRAQLEDILNARANMVFKPDGLEPGVIPYCAARAAQTHGDARLALGMLHKAAVLAEKDGVEQVTMQHILAARGALEHDVIAEGIERLTFQEKILLFAIARLTQAKVPNNMITMGMLHDGYRRVCGQLGMEPMSPTSIARLMGDIMEQGLATTDVRSFGRARGRTTVVTLTAPVDLTIQVVMKEPLFHGGG